MLRFHASIRGASTENAERSLLVTFDQASMALAALPRLYLEPDGSFVWTGTASDGQFWQVDGNLIDQGEQLAYVEVKGSCPAAQVDQLLAALGWPQIRLAFELPRRGIVLDEAEFRPLAASDAGAI